MNPILEHFSNIGSRNKRTSFACQNNHIGFRIGCNFIECPVQFL